MKINNRGFTSTGFSKIWLLVGIVVFILVIAYVMGARATPSLRITSPILSNTGNQILKPGKYEVQWKARGVEKVVVAVIKETNSYDNSIMMIASSGHIDASSGSYYIEVPSVPPRIMSNKDAQQKYRFWIGTDSGMIVQSKTFLIDSED